MTTPNPALSAFVEAELVEPFTLEGHNKDLSSDLFIGTATDIAQAATSLVHSPHGGVSGPNKVTGALYGAGRALHLITSGATGHPNRTVRSLFVLVLTAAITMLLIDVLSAESPGWLTNVGFSILLGGIGAIALHFRQPLLGAVLLTLGLPLVALSLTEASDMESADDWVGQAITIVGIVAVLVIIGYVQEPSAATLAPPKAADATIDPGAQPRPARWLVTAFVALLLVVALGVGLYELLRQLLPGYVPVLVFGLLATAAGVAGGLRLLALKSSAQTGRATVASWAFGLGVLYLLVALGFLGYFTFSDNVAATNRYLPMTVSLIVLGLGCTLLPLVVREKKPMQARPTA